MNILKITKMENSENKIQEQAKELRLTAQKRYEEYADVHSEKNFTALHRALQVYENALTTAEQRGAEREREQLLNIVKVGKERFVSISSGSDWSKGFLECLQIFIDALPSK